MSESASSDFQREEDTAEEFVDYDSLIKAIPTSIGEKRWCKAFQCLATYLGFLHASTKDASVAKTKQLIQQYSFEGFNTRTAEMCDYNTYLFESVLYFNEWGFDRADVSRAKGITLEGLREGMRIDNVLRIAKEDVAKEVKKYTQYWTKCLGPDKQIPSERLLVLYYSKY